MRNFFVSLLKIFLLFALCVFSAFAVSFPLWIFSTKAPFAYTAVFLFFFFAAFVYGIIKTFKKEMEEDDEPQKVEKKMEQEVKDAEISDTKKA